MSGTKREVRALRFGHPFRVGPIQTQKAAQKQASENCHRQGGRHADNFMATRRSRDASSGLVAFGDCETVSARQTVEAMRAVLSWRSGGERGEPGLHNPESQTTSKADAGPSSLWSEVSL